MLIDYNSKNNQLILTEESGESFITLQNCCGFKLCPKLRNDSYQVPFIALPIVLKAINSLKYAALISQELKDYYAAYNNWRKYLSDLKDRNYKKDDEKIWKILAFVKELESEINTRFQAFYNKKFNFYSNQIETIVYAIIGQRIVIGNDIGTGKTLTSLVVAKYLIKYENVKKILIMLPASLVKNFYNDYLKFFKDTEMLMVCTETKAKRSKLYELFRINDNFKFLITNYEKCNFDEEDLRKLSFDCIIVDEFHRMKNFISAKRSINFFDMIQNKWKPKYRYPMSGTPIENKLFDLYPVFKLLDDGKVLGGQKFFDNNFVEYTEKTYPLYIYGKNKAPLIKTQLVATGFKNYKFIQNLIKPYIIKKKLDLPVDCYRQDIEIEPSSKFLDHYHWVKQQFSNNSAKYIGVRQFLCDTTRHNWEDNPKYEELENIITQTSSKVIIFSFFKCSIGAIGNYLNKLGYKYVTCMGGDEQDPFDVVKKFENDPNIKCLITTDKINFGHNIQCAKIVIEWEKPIKPTITMQRIGRAYRTGQTEDVHVYSFVVKKTIEDIIQQQWVIKKEVIDKIIETMGTNSTNETLNDMIEKLDINMEEEIMKAFLKEKN